MRFPLGKPILAMILLSLVGGAGLLIRPRTRHADQTVWAFGESDVTEWRDLTADYHSHTGRSVDVKEVSAHAIDMRLESLFISDQRGASVPDVVTIEIGSVGKFFRPPAEEVGLLPLEAFVKRDGLDNTFLRSRLTPWSKGGHLFGLPLDVHPVSITYRRDLYKLAGIDLAATTNWSEFQTTGLKYQAYWRTHGHPERAAIELPESSADVLYMMLLQRGINLIDEANRVHAANPRVAQTVAFYAGLVAGPKRIGQSAGSNPAVRVRSLADGDVGAMVTPDWEVDAIRQWGPDLAGKLAMIPLPRFDPEDYPTSTWGGTMAGIPRNSRDPESAWQLLKFLTMNRQAMLPAVVAHWDEPKYHAPDPLFGGQRVGELYVSLARQLPPRYVTPFTTIGTGGLSLVLHRAVSAVERGESDEELLRHSRQWLDATAADLEKYIAFTESR